MTYTIDYGLDGPDGPESYESLLERLNASYKWITAREDNYQGEWWAVGINCEGEYAFHQGTFGSCSGCDMLMGIEDEKDALQVFKMLEHIIPLSRSKEKTIQYLRDAMANAWDDAQTPLQSLIDRIEELTA